jgi:excisionase family DNA binding protein
MEQYFRIGEAAQYLRAQPASVRRWVRQGRLPARRSGNYFLFTKKDLRNFLELVTPRHPKE